jgi:hypothetical protein
MVSWGVTGLRMKDFSMSERHFYQELAAAARNESDVIARCFIKEGDARPTWWNEVMF